MANIQIPTTLVADSGTGALLVPYRLAGDVAIYRESAPVGQPALFSLKRVEPKPTKDYAGAMRTEAKLTRQHADAQGRLWPSVITLSSSIPAFLTDTQKTALVLEAVLTFNLAETRSALATQVIPQS